MARFCAGCGSEVEIGAAFCVSCGRAVQSTTLPTDVDPAQAQTASTHGGLVIALVAGGLAALAIVLAGVWFVFLRNDASRAATAFMAGTWSCGLPNTAAPVTFTIADQRWEASYVDPDSKATQTQSGGWVLGSDGQVTITGDSLDTNDGGQLSGIPLTVIPGAGGTVVLTSHTGSTSGSATYTIAADGQSISFMNPNTSDSWTCTRQ